MASLFNTTAQLQHTTPIPAGVSPSKAISFLQGHEFVIHYDPHMVTYEKIATPDPAPTMSPERQLIATGTPPVCYSITDRVHALPVGLWDSDVVSTYEFIDVERGVFVRLRSPLSVTMETVWTVREVEGSSGESEGETQHELVEDIVISCSRLLMGTVKGTCESGWKEIHEKMMGHLKEQSAAQ